MLEAASSRRVSASGRDRPCPAPFPRQKSAPHLQQNTSVGGRQQFVPQLVHFLRRQLCSTDAILPRGVGLVALSILLLVRRPASGDCVDESDPRQGSDDGDCEPLVIGVARSGFGRRTVLFCIFQRCGRPFSGRSEHSRINLREFRRGAFAPPWKNLLCKYNSRLCVSVKTLGRARKAAKRGDRYEIAVVDEGS